MTNSTVLSIAARLRGGVWGHLVGEGRPAPGRTHLRSALPARAVDPAMWLGGGSGSEQQVPRRGPSQRVHVQRSKGSHEQHQS
jgi:hypothetical protein